MPVAHVVPGELDAVAGAQPPFEAVKGLVVAELFSEQECSEAGGEDAAGQEAGFEGRGDGDGVGVVFANVGLADDDLASEGVGLGVQAHAGFLADEAVVVGVGEDFGVNNGALDGREIFEGAEKFLSGLAPLGLWRGGVLVSRRSLVFGLGVVGLFSLFLQKGEEELLLAHFLAFDAVDAGQEGGDKVSLNL